jgi:hypothetical protein
MACGWFQFDVGQMLSEMKIKLLYPVGRPLSKWLCHADARQVSDLPAEFPHLFMVSDPSYGRRPKISKRTLRQVRDLPRIGVAEPGRQ